MVEIITGDALEVLKTLPSETVNCIVTSPPYYGLRDYQTATWVGGDASCKHIADKSKTKTFGNGEFNENIPSREETKTKGYYFESVCPACGAVKVDRQIGLEETPEAYIEKLVAVFHEARRVLRDDGTLWVNIGDSYAGSGKGAANYPDSVKGTKQGTSKGMIGASNCILKSPVNCKPKDIIGIPWMLAFALRADGWVLRQEIIWAKSNPMPESVTDRCTKSHEQIFLLSKAKWAGPEKRQFDFISDQDARWLALFLDTEGNICAKRAKSAGGSDHFGTQICFASTSKQLLETAKLMIGRGTVLERSGKNAPMYYYQLSNIQAADLLYRIYPYLIIKQRQAALGIHLQSVIAYGDQERRTKAGRLRGRLRDDDYTEELIRIWASMKQLNHFGNPDLSWLPLPKYGHWKPLPYYYDADAIKEQSYTFDDNVRDRDAENNSLNKVPGRTRMNGLTHNDYLLRNKRSVWEVATQPYAEAHFATFPPDLIKPCILAGCPENGTVLDMFGGSGTTGYVASGNNRNAILIDLNPQYSEMQYQRCGMFARSKP